MNEFNFFVDQYYERIFFDFFEELEDNNYSFQIFKPFKLKKVKPEFQK